MPTVIIDPDGADAMVMVLVRIERALVLVVEMSNCAKEEVCQFPTGIDSKSIQSNLRQSYN
jgi:hypothetical protein